ncbi:hypothetical protein HanPI659440_Chr11g0406911 [Helianthus annuus]|nr:hypothetical protein HanPI659440_Chr11g0406911 [Helianthus annuus]
MVWRHSDVVLNKKEPSENELDKEFLLKNRFFHLLVFIPFQERLLVLLSLSTKWEHSYRDTLLFRNGEGMSALDFMKSDDTSNVEVTTQAVLEGENGPVNPEHVDLGGETSEESQDDVIASISASEVVVTSKKSKKVVVEPSKVADSKTEDTFPRLTADMKGAVYVPD